MTDRLAQVGALVHALGEELSMQRQALQIRQEKQLNAVGDDVLALTAVVRPILTGVLNALKADVVAEAGSRSYEQRRQQSN